MHIKPENTVYAKAEAIKHHLDWLHWRDPAVVKESYVISDDDMVLQVLNVYDAVNSRGCRNRLVRTALGLCSEFSKYFYVTDDARRRYNIGNNRHDIVGPSTRERRMIDLYTAGLSLDDACMKVHQCSYQNLKSQISLMLKKGAVIKYMTEALKAAFAKAGITENFIAEELKSLVTDPDARAADRLESLKYA